MAEVPCSTVVDLARAVRAASGDRTSKAVKEFAKRKKYDAEGKVHRIIAKFQLCLPVPLSRVDSGIYLNGFPRLKPIDFLKHMLETGHLNKLLGGHSIASCGPMLLEFWRNYKDNHPDYELFEYTGGARYDDNSVQLEITIPVYAHIDGGRGYKRSEFMVFDWCSVIGQGTGKQNRKDPGVRFRKAAKKMQINLLGHSFMSHYLYAAMPSSLHKGKEAVFQEMLQIFAMDLRECFDVGLTMNDGRILRLALLGLKGDLKLQAQAGRFNAWYSTARKRPVATVRGIAAMGRCCPWCPAGDVEAPFEELHTETPVWLRMKAQDPAPPWTQDDAGGMLGASLGYSSDPAKFYVPDLFHIYLMGIGGS